MKEAGEVATCFLVRLTWSLLYLLTDYDLTTTG